MPDKTPPPDSPDSRPDSQHEDDENLVEFISSEPIRPDPPEKPAPPPDFPVPPRRPFREQKAPSETVFRVLNGADRRMTVHISGTMAFTSQPLQGWDIDFGALNIQMEDMGRFLARYDAHQDKAGRASWQQAAQELGIHLYNGLLNVDPALKRRLLMLRQRVRPGSRLTLAFEGPRAYLGVPYELLHDGRSPLAIEHPITRRITEYPSNHTQPLDVVARDLQTASEPLRVLLLTGHQDANAEVITLEEGILWHANRAQRTITVDVLSGSPGTVRARLADYHIIHYAGPLYYDRHNPANSGLLINAHQDTRLGQDVITAPELAELLRASQAQLVYLSGNIAAGERSAALLRDGDQFEVLDALVRAGVPYVIGLRWYTTGEGRQQLAGYFYQHLLRQMVPQRALLVARRAIYHRQDEAWASPLLVAQNL